MVRGNVGVWVGLMWVIMGGMVEAFRVSGAMVAGPGPRLTAVG